MNGLRGAPRLGGDRAAAGPARCRSRRARRRRRRSTDPASAVANRGGADVRRTRPRSAAARRPSRRRPARTQAAGSRRCRVEFVAIERAGGRDDGEAVARRERARLEHHSEAGHLVGDGAMLVAAERAAAAPCPSSGRGASRRGEEALLGALLALQRVLDARERQALLFDRVDQRLERRRLRVVVAAADQDAVAAGLDRQHGRRRAPRSRWRSPSSRDRRSGSRPRSRSSSRRIPVTMRFDKRRRPLLVERRHEDVRGHDRGDAGLDGRPERHELDRAQPLRRMLDERQLEVRIGRSCRRARESACRRRRCPRPAASATIALPSRATSSAFSASARSPITGFFGIGVDVEHRRVVERDADGLQLRRQRAREPLGQRDVAAAPERRHRRPLGERRLQPRDAAAFLIDADPERQIRHEPRRLVATARRPAPARRCCGRRG